MKTILFNSSMPRSGSELLQVLLHQNPSIYGSTTSPVLGLMSGILNNAADESCRAIPKETLQSAVSSGMKSFIQGYYDGITDRPVVVDKSRGWLPKTKWIKGWSGETPKVVCMVRDLRGIAASMEKKYQANLNTKQCAMLPDRLSQRVPFWLSMEDPKGGPGTPPIGPALNNIKTVFESGEFKNVLFVKYEDLCEDPAKTMAGNYKYLGLDEFEHDFEKIEKKVEEIPDSFGAFGDHNVSGKISPPSDWNEVLPQNISDEIRNQFAWYYKLLNY